MTRSALLCLVLAALAALAGCATVAQTRYYSLSVPTPAAEAPDGAPSYRVAIGPVTMPEAVDRRQLVLRIAPNRYAISDTDRWTEPLKDRIPRVLAAEVRGRLPQARVAAHVQHGGQDADYRVLIDVIRFESVPNESIRLEAAWDIKDRSGARLREGRYARTEPVRSPGIAPLVAAHEKALAALAREIAAAIDALAPARR